MQALISHLDKRGNIHIANPAAKRGILDTVSQCIEVASEGFLGPSAMDAFTVLLKHLKASLDECSIRDATIETLVRCKAFIMQAIVFAELVKMVHENLAVYVHECMQLQNMQLSVYLSACACVSPDSICGTILSV